MKKIFIIALSLLALLVIVALLAPFFIPADAMKRLAVTNIEQALGRKVEIDTLAVRVFPFVGVHMEGVMWDPLESTCRHASLSIL